MCSYLSLYPKALGLLNLNKLDVCPLFFVALYPVHLNDFNYDPSFFDAFGLLDLDICN